MEGTNIEQTQVKEIYEEIAEHFDNTRLYKWNWVNEFLNNLRKDSLVYDIGCGNGRNMINNNFFVLLSIKLYAHYLIC
jgi:ubiquinone/menaquinone biosynthesis C-methylase UbiE